MKYILSKLVYKKIDVSTNQASNLQWRTVLMLVYERAYVYANGKYKPNNLINIKKC